MEDRLIQRVNEGLFPYGKSGLKLDHPFLEIHARNSLFPYGKSGLKSFQFFLILHLLRSLPVWEEWIEIVPQFC